jgi:hypothetical protein
VSIVAAPRGRTLLELLSYGSRSRETRVHVKNPADGHDPQSNPQMSLEIDPSSW